MRKYWISIITTVMGLCLVSQASLIAHYTFDDSAHLTNDVSGNGKNLSLYDGTYGTPGYTAEGMFDGASTFNGSTQGWVTPTAVFTPTFTIALWVKPLGTSSIVVIPASLTGGYEIYVANGAYRFATLNNVGGQSYKISTAAPSIGTWQHLALTYTATNTPDANGNYLGVMNAYVDGALVGTLTGATNCARSTLKLAIGRRSTSVFNGVMDDIYMYDHALTQTEILSLIPEPASVGLLGLGALVVLFLRKRIR